MDIETWKSLHLFPNDYEVSDHGRIRNKKTLFVLTQQTHRGHKFLLIRGKKIYVHRAVAIAFIPKEPRKPLVDHCDGRKDNNHVSNLRWSTHASNTRNAVALGTHRPGSAPRAVIARDKEGTIHHRFRSIRAAERHLRGCSTGEICRAIAGQYPAYGYTWTFDETAP
jgi:hypothetical protein